MINKSFRISIFVFTFVILFQKPSYAFLPPDTVSLILASVGSTLAYFFAIIFANVLLLFKKGMKNLKLVILCVSMCALIVLIVISCKRYFKLKEINNFHHDVILSKYMIDLNAISSDELSGYRIFQIQKGITDIVTVPNTTKIKDGIVDVLLNNFPNIDEGDDSKEFSSKEGFRFRQSGGTFEYIRFKEIIEIITDMPLEMKNGQDLFKNKENLLNNLNQFAAKHNISKKDKILFLCSRGGASRIVVDAFREAGYDNAFYAVLLDVFDDQSNIIDTILKRNTYSTLLITVPYSFREKKKQNISFLFDQAELDDYMRDSPQMNDQTVKKGAVFIDYTDFDMVSLEDKNIVCGYNLHCLLTKYLLDSHGIKERYIYQIQRW